MSTVRTRFAAVALIAALSGGAIEVGAASSASAATSTPRMSLSVGESTMAPIAAKPCWAFKKAKKRRNCYWNRGWHGGWWKHHRKCKVHKAVLTVTKHGWKVKKYRSCGWRGWW